MARRPKPDDDLLTSAKSWFEADYDASRSWRDKAEESYAFVRGEQWDAGDKAKLERQGRPALTFNEVLPQIDLSGGIIRQQKLGYRALPRGGEDALVSTISTALLSYAMARTNGEHELYRGHDDGDICGKAWWEVMMDKDFTDDPLGEVEVRRLPPLAIIEDMGAERPDRQDAEHMAKAMWFSESAAKRRWPEHSDAFRVGEWLGHGGGPIEGWSLDKQRLYLNLLAKQIRVLFMWYKVPATLYTVTDTFLGATRTFTEGADLEAFLREAQQGHSAEISTFEKRFPTDTRKTYSLRVATFTGWRLLDDRPSPFTNTRLFPFVPMLVHDFGDEPFGVVENIKDAQREINKRRSVLLHIMQTTANSGWMTKREALTPQQKVELKNMGADPGLVVEYTGNVSPQKITPSPMPNSFVEYDAMMRNSIRSTTMRNAELMGQTTQQTVSGVAIQARQRGGLVGMQGLEQAFALSRRFVGHMILKRIQQFYSEEKMQRVLGDLLTQGEVVPGMPEDQAQGLEFLKAQQAVAAFKRLRDMEMDLVLEPEAIAPSVRAQQFMDLMELQRAGFPVPPDVLLEASDVPQKEKIRRALKAVNNQLTPPPMAGASGRPAPQPMGGL